MNSYTQAAMERAMKVQEVMLQAMAMKITWWQAAEILGISDRHMRRWRERMRSFWVPRAVRPQARSTVGEAGAGGPCRAVAGAVPGTLFRYERAALPRSWAPEHSQLQLGERDSARSRLGRAGAQD
jgi:hypothetical protein